MTNQISSEDKYLFSLMKLYYELLNSEDMKNLTNKYFHYTTTDIEKADLINKNKKDIKKLKELFISLIIERNKFANRRGNGDYIEYSLSRDRVPTNLISKILKINKISNFDYIWKNIDYDFSKYTLPEPLYFINPKKYNLDAHIKNFKYSEKISIKQSKSFKTKIVDGKVIVYADLKRNSLYALSNLIHELGHAVHYFNDPNTFDKLTRFEREKFAYDYQRKSLKKIVSPVELDVVDWKLTYYIADAHFEYQIHKNPKINIQQAFNESREIVYPYKFNGTYIDYLLDFKYQKYAAESIMRAAATNL